MKTSSKTPLKKTTPDASTGSGTLNDAASAIFARYADIQTHLHGQEPEWLLPTLNPKLPGADAGAY